MNEKIVIHDSIATIAKEQWNQLAHNAGPFLQYEFLSALEVSGCCGGDTGWQPFHVTVEREGRIVLAAPGYLKTHSYGEYVFDHAWANAYHQHGLEYYPKWIAAVPFTPVTGRRLLVKEENLLSADLVQDIGNSLKTECESRFGESLSSLHWLFVGEDEDQALDEERQYLTRHSVQFQWHNYNYAGFDDFLSALTSRKRKSINKTRKALLDKGIRFSHRTGRSIDADTLSFFVKCYQSTYLKRSGHVGYLNKAFFETLVNTMSERILIVTAEEHQVPIASALFFYDSSGLYGRYWGALKQVDSLHFACCYFEGIEFAINNKLPHFNPGTQGEHKILRGFEPVYCKSKHQLLEFAFHDAVANFLQQENQHIVHYFNQAQNALPFNQEFVPTLKTKSVIHPNDDT
ncbi:GNAT family N-acetyltransferase [Alteromonas hispanica]|uniref:GNAT family N-acetyltransferase n=1 Tax=Alteromonas hispanica TaxID=315421 RepID=A0A6L9MS29_9ALTE|nr:peptidogalycan biosysnthesis protein [Alteromonas hispanica]NDW20711.1 GNAT family N-acetyltransferase [Alteromonas hispanica]